MRALSSASAERRPASSALKSWSKSPTFWPETLTPELTPALTWGSVTRSMPPGITASGMAERGFKSAEAPAPEVIASRRDKKLPRLGGGVSAPEPCCGVRAAAGAWAAGCARPGALGRTLGAAALAAALGTDAFEPCLVWAMARAAARRGPRLVKRSELKVGSRSASNWVSSSWALEVSLSERGLSPDFKCKVLVRALFLPRLLLFLELRSLSNRPSSPMIGSSSLRRLVLFCQK